MFPSINRSDDFQKRDSHSIILNSRCVYLHHKENLGKAYRSVALPSLFAKSQENGRITDRLQPPSQLQTRYKARRYSFVKNQKPISFVGRLNGLVKVEDSSLRKRKEEIMERIRISELKEKNDCKRHVSNNADEEQNSDTDLTSNEDNDEESQNDNEKGHSNCRRRSSLLKQKLKERRVSTILSSLVLTGIHGEKKDSVEPYPEKFSFMEQWSN